MSGIIAGAIGGLGQGLATAGEIGMRKAAATDLENVRAENDQKRAAFMEELRTSSADKQRVAAVERREQAKMGIINSQIDDEFATAVPADASAWTPEQQAAVDQAKGMRRNELDRDVNLDLRAGMKTGDIDPKDVATLGQRDAANESRLLIAQMRADALNAKTEAQLEAAKAKIEAAVAKAGSGNTDFDKKIALLKAGGLDEREIANFILERKQPSLEDLAANFLKSDSMAGTRKAMTPTQAMEKARELRSLTRDLDAAATGSRPHGPAPSAAPATAQSAPAGAPAQPKSKAEYDALPKGARYIKNGVEYIKK